MTILCERLFFDYKINDAEFRPSYLDALEILCATNQWRHLTEPGLSRLIMAPKKVGRSQTILIIPHCIDGKPEIGLGT